MMYSEFIEGTGCKDTPNNHKVFLNLEVMYMNSDLTKEEIYTYGKKLVDNSKTKREIAFEKEIKARIREHKEAIETIRRDIKREIELWGESAKSGSWVKYCKDELKFHQHKIKALKWVLQ